MTSLGRHSYWELIAPLTVAKIIGIFDSMFDFVRENFVFIITSSLIVAGITVLSFEQQEERASTALTSLNASGALVTISATSSASEPPASPTPSASPQTPSISPQINTLPATKTTIPESLVRPTEDDDDGDEFED